MRRIAALSLLLALCALPASAQLPPLLERSAAEALAAELDGDAAQRNLEALALQHRMRGSRQFRAAAGHIAAQLKRYGLSEVEVAQFPADGKVFYGTQRSRPAWNAEFAELWEMAEREGKWTPRIRIASWETMPMSLAQDSESGEAEADLIDIGAGTSEKDYAGKEVRGRFVLTSSQPGAVAELAVGKHGAAGLVSYAQNQHTAWWGEDENLVRWGHLDTFAATKTFAFMVSLKQARAWQQRLARGERVRLSGTVRAGQEPGSYHVVMATIPGSDPQLRAQEVAFSCHLDHPRPGANDNASGCATILEVARAYAKLVREKRLPAPARTLRFVWPPEIEGTLALLNARPELAQRIAAVIHMDMVGGGPETKAIFHITRGPASLPSFINDVAESIGEFVNRESDRFASTGRADFPLNAPTGGKEALLAQMAEFSMGSDHQIYTDSSWGIPAIYLNDWPDRYIHTTGDVPGNIDPSKLQRAAFIGAAAAHILANLRAEHAPAALDTIRERSLRRTATMLQRRRGLEAAEAAGLTRFHLWHERGVVDSLGRFFAIPAAVRREADAFLRHLEALAGGEPPASRPSGAVYRRDPRLKGTMGGFGYDYFEDKYGAEGAQQLRLLRHSGLRGSGSEYAYEVLNLADGRRTVSEIRGLVSAIYGPVPEEYVAEYLEALESIGVVQRAGK
jgi:aminopeptidase YwaD